MKRFSSLVLNFPDCDDRLQPSPLFPGSAEHPVNRDSIALFNRVLAGQIIRSIKKIKVSSGMADRDVTSGQLAHIVGEKQITVLDDHPFTG